MPGDLSKVDIRYFCHEFWYSITSFLTQNFGHVHCKNRQNCYVDKQKCAI